MVHGVVCLPYRVVHNESSQDVFTLPLLGMLTTKACGLVLLVTLHYIYCSLNMLDDGTSGSNKTLISKQERRTLAQCSIYWMAWTYGLI
ncbi:hypothetical protein O0I10_013350 [Lichtheimia ornata]|uniref:Uncharacterized protein n=1 Tax=Lichtheimia ornata TaxID=688661 RepID=A0AAD7XQZ6_9FUNG|nr:uncharacterized protein O0I10_013350 [Lichtheimia ornata]KAJ8651200.1 hypothetical protein O0I10_013350 [Lichtheimia ornata]